MKRGRGNSGCKFYLCNNARLVQCLLLLISLGCIIFKGECNHLNHVPLPFPESGCEIASECHYDAWEMTDVGWLRAIETVSFYRSTNT